MIWWLLACNRDPCGSGELAVPCRVEQAAKAAAAGDEAGAGAACRKLEEGPWQQECHFRAGEELGGAGKIAAGLDHCQQAGRFRLFCLTHLSWHIPADTPGTADDWSSLSSHLPSLREEAQQHLRSRWWFNHYYGTGTADASSAKNAPLRDQPYARGAWALEAARLSSPDVSSLLSAWDGPPLTGPSLPPEKRVGRYDPPPPIDGESELPHIPTFGGSRRLISEDPATDLKIAILEALYFRESTRGDVFEGFLDAAQPKPLRYTAIRLFRILPSEHPEETLQKYQEDPDSVVREHVRDALQYHTWEGKKQGK